MKLGHFGFSLFRIFEHLERISKRSISNTLEYIETHWRALNVRPSLIASLLLFVVTGSLQLEQTTLCGLKVQTVHRKFSWDRPIRSLLANFEQENGDYLPITGDPGRHPIESSANINGVKFHHPANRRFVWQVARRLQ